MMSPSARKLTSARILVALAFAITLIVSVRPAHCQNNSVPASQVAEMVVRVRTESLGAQAARPALSMGQRLLIEQRYSEASELFEALLEKWPREPLALYGAALAAFNLGRLERAEPLVRSAAEIYVGGAGGEVDAKSLWTKHRTEGADALVLLAVILATRGEDAQALKSVQRAVALAPEHFDAQFTLGRALYSVGDSAAAVKAFRAALKLKPDDAKALFFLATTLEGAGDSEAAFSAYRDLARRQPRAAEGHLGLGVLLIKRGGAEVEKGIEELRTAVRIDPKLYEAQVTLGRALLMQKLTEESVEHLRRAAELAPGNPEPHYQLALAYRRMGLNDKAVEETAIVKRIHESRRGEGAQNNPVKPERR
jgi:tetratricopeptide (TPR) repeat protein